MTYRCKNRCELATVNKLAEKQESLAKRRPEGSGRRKVLPGLSGKAAREYLAKHSNVLEIYCRVTRGQAIKLSGPTGKQKWHYPTWDDVRWVCERLDRKLIPDLTATQLTGEDGGPIETTGTLIRDDRELGRRLALALNRAMPTEIAGEAEVIDATPAEPPVNGTKKPTEAPVLPDDTVGGLEYARRGQRRSRAILAT